MTVDMTTADRTYTPVIALPAAPAFLRYAGLDEDEQKTLAILVSKITRNLLALELRDAYYNGTAIVKDLGISIPPQMRGLKVVTGWPRTAIDALDERLFVEGFRLPGETDLNDELQTLWDDNGMATEAPLAHLDALIFGRGFVTVGTGDERENDPLVVVESPLTMAASYDVRERRLTGALRLHGDEAGAATLYLPGQTIYLERTANGGAPWVITERDQHKLGVVPVVVLPNRSRSGNRDGASEITTEMMSITDSACRTLQGLEIAREFYSAPQRYILGANESAFQNVDGTARTAWQTYMGRILALEADDEGNSPTVGQFQAYDPSVFTKVLEMLARNFSSLSGLPPHQLGFQSDNPASADAIRSSENSLQKKAERKTRIFGGPWCDVMRLVYLVRDGAVPFGLSGMAAVWADTATPTPAQTTDALSKQIASKMVPPRSDVVLGRAGYTATERKQIAQDWDEQEARAALDSIATALTSPAAPPASPGADRVPGPPPASPGASGGDTASPPAV